MPVVPTLTVDGGKAALEFYKSAFGATVANDIHLATDGVRIMHAEISVFGSPIYVNDAFPEWDGGKKNDPKSYGGSSVQMDIRLGTPEEVDKWFENAVKHGATSGMPPGDMFWGDRYGAFKDPFGHRWALGAPLPKDRAEQAAKAKEAQMTHPKPTEEESAAKRQKTEPTGPAIVGLHAMIYSSEAKALREFLRDQVGLVHYKDVGGGWLIFDQLDVELGVHPSDTEPHSTAGTHSLSMVTKDIDAARASFASKGVKFVDEVTESDWGRVCHFELPGAGKIMLYQAKY